MVLRGSLHEILRRCAPQDDSVTATPVRCHPERSEGSHGPARKPYEILRRCAPQDDSVTATPISLSSRAQRGIPPTGAETIAAGKTPALSP